MRGRTRPRRSLFGGWRRVIFDDLILIGCIDLPRYMCHYFDHTIIEQNIVVKLECTNTASNIATKIVEVKCSFIYEFFSSSFNIPATFITILFLRVPELVQYDSMRRPR